VLLARKLEEDTEALWLRNELLIQRVFYIIVPELIACKMFDNMSVTLCQIYVQTEERKFRHKAVGCSDGFTKLLITFRYENLLRMSLGLLLAGPSALRFLSSCAGILV